ncbi:hypothetical protein M3Y94_01173200 [Aphelenchoides besseyi]|nr:hypothetical protein M3Y94_01173200 [Aphelenchoides besseyi]KAI6228174.1 hypothetical protein M3Y95_00594500 [Aphelenchoides besseyi]
MIKLIPSTFNDSSILRLRMLDAQIRRQRFERQMALRTSSTGSGENNSELPEGFAVRQGHLAASIALPDSPRPQATTTSENQCLTTLTVPGDKSANKNSTPKSRT